MFHERSHFFTRSEYEYEIPCDTCGELIHYGQRVEYTDLGTHIHHRACYIKNVANTQGE